MILKFLETELLSLILLCPNCIPVGKVMLEAPDQTTSPESSSARVCASRRENPSWGTTYQGWPLETVYCQVFFPVPAFCVFIPHSKVEIWGAKNGPICQ